MTDNRYIKLAMMKKIRGRKNDFAKVELGQA